MGHTLVAVFNKNDFADIEKLIKQEAQFNVNKIPYGRDCDREEANNILPYHMTVFHWAKANDEKYLNKLAGYRFTPFKIEVSNVNIMFAEEGSYLVYFAVNPGENYSQFNSELQAQLNEFISSYGLHITIAVTKEADKAEALLASLKEKLSFPFTLSVSGLELYHIWKPVELIKSYFNGESDD